MSAAGGCDRCSCRRGRGGKGGRRYIVCQDYQRLGGCSRTSEQVRWLAWLKLDIQACGRVVMKLRARGEKNLVSWENARDSSTITQWIELSWAGRVEEKTVG